MPGPLPTEFVAYLHPPAESVLEYEPGLAPSRQSDKIPPDFLAAMAVREAVFVQEQRIPAENEFDADDPRSFHWVVYVSVASSVRENGRKGTETAKVAAATVRLVPPPHPPHPAPGSAHKIDNAEAASQVDEAPRTSEWHDGVEPYAKLGRLATIPSYRGLGLGRLVVGSALEWAGKHPLAVVPLPSPMSTEAAKVGGGLGQRLEWKGLLLVHAQKTVEKMWKSLGFETDEAMGVWLEEGIEHVGMWRRIPVKEEKPYFR